MFACVYFMIITDSMTKYFSAIRRHDWSKSSLCYILIMYQNSLIGYLCYVFERIRGNTLFEPYEKVHKCSSSKVNFHLILDKKFSVIIFNRDQ